MKENGREPRINPHSFSMMTHHDVSHLDEKLLNGRYMKLLSAKEYEDIPNDSLRLWCHENGRYGIPTLELINWLKEIIGCQKCIEIGAGAGDLGRYLNIIQTDSKLQESKICKAYYQAMNHPTIKYSDTIRKLDALDAVIKYEPDVVIGSWVTQFVAADNYQGEKEANMFGVKEDEIIKRVKIYIMIGNEIIHGTKKILSLPHEAYYFPWLKSKTQYQDKNVIYVWRNNGS